MHLPPLRFPSRFLLLPVLLLTLGLVGVRGEDSSPAPAVSNETPLVIKHGVIVGAGTDAQPTRATLRALSELIMRKYPTVTINIVGVDDVTVDDLTFRWTRSSRGNGGEAAGVALDAFAAATGNSFRVERGWNDTFLLTNRQDEAHPRRIEVFNLQLYLEGPGDRAELENEVRDAEMDLEYTRKRIEALNAAVAQGKQPEVELAALKVHVTDEENRLNLLTQRLKRKNLTKEETSKRLDELVNTVHDTLQKFSPGEKQPEFEYHAGTHLLIVIGSDAAIDVTRKVVNALQPSSK